MVFALGVPSSSNITDGKLSPSLFKLKDISFPLFHKRWFCSCWLAAASVVTISAGKLFFQFLHVLHTFYLVRKKSCCSTLVELKKRNIHMTSRREKGKKVDKTETKELFCILFFSSTIFWDGGAFFFTQNMWSYHYLSAGLLLRVDQFCKWSIWGRCSKTSAFRALAKKQGVPTCLCGWNLLISYCLQSCQIGMKNDVCFGDFLHRSNFLGMQCFHFLLRLLRRQ